MHKFSLSLKKSAVSLKIEVMASASIIFNESYESIVNYYDNEPVKMETDQSISP